MLAPLDAQAGGTWLGVNASGVFAAVTNQRCTDPDPGRASRGLLVVEALGAASAEEALSRFESLPADFYNPFNLFVADRWQAGVVAYAGKSERLDLAPGAHVVGNLPPGDHGSPKLRRLRGEVARVLEGPAARVLDSLAAVCRRHADGDPLQATCVHAGEYGTRSSTLLVLPERLQDGVMRYAEGPPCSAEYRDFTPLLRELGRGSRSVEGEPIARKVS